MFGSMVFNPTSPIRVSGRKVANSSRPVAAEPYPRTAPPPTTQLPHSAAPSSTMGSTLREGMSRLRHLSRDRDATPQEISRWSKTTTESEASEAVVKDQPPRPRNVLKIKTKQKRKSKDTTNSSPVDPSYDPTTKRFLTEGGSDVPPIAVSAPIRPKSFYDSGSDDSDQESPVIERASSVRVAKPNIVQHNNNSGGSIPRLYASHSTPTEVESGTAKDLEASNGRSLFPLAGGKEQNDQSDNLSGPEDALKALEGRDPNEDTLTALPQVISFKYQPEQDDSVKETILEFPDTPGRVEALSTLPTPMGGFGSVRLPRSGAGTTSSTSGTFVSTTPSIDGLRSNPPTELEKKLSRAISAPVRNSRRVTIRPADLIITQTNNDHKLFRENIVSTPYPARQSSIGEIDKIVAATASRRGKPSKEHSSKNKDSTSSKFSRSLRRSRSTRKQSLSSSSPSPKVDVDGNVEKQPQHSSADPLAEKDETAPEIPLSTKPILGGASSTPAKSDRFPSPVAPEVLFLDLRLARHPSAKTTIEIEITDKTNFDDEQLFTLIQKSYRSRLLGMARRLFSARVLSYASPNADLASASIGTSTTPAHRYWYPGSPLPALTLGGGASAHEIDGTDFVNHLRNPRLGRRRKMWLLWLRNNQQTESFTSSRRNRTRHADNNNSPSDGVSPVFSFMGHSRNGSRESADPYGAQQPPLTASSAPGVLTFSSSCGGGAADMNNGATAANLLRAKPSVNIPRMPFQQQPQPPTFPMSYRSLSRSHHHHNHHHFSGMGAGGSRESSSNGVTGPPCLYLHYTFSLSKIVSVLAAVLFLAIFTSVMWVLFGLPGRGADQGDTTTLVEGHEYIVGWKRDAQIRAGVAVVMGIAVLLGGVVCEAVWIWGSWVLI